MTAMGDEQTYHAMQWFAAGYLAADPEPERAEGGDAKEAARLVASRYIDKYGDGVCLDCGRRGVVLLDGMFCERCHRSVMRYIDD